MDSWYLFFILCSLIILFFLIRHDGRKEFTASDLWPSRIAVLLGLIIIIEGIIAIASRTLSGIALGSLIIASAVLVVIRYSLMAIVGGFYFKRKKAGY